jgi:hypothetical protein
MKGLELLGLRVRDLVTGREGIVTSISFDASDAESGPERKPIPR